MKYRIEEIEVPRHAGVADPGSNALDLPGRRIIHVVGQVNRKRIKGAPASDVLHVLTEDDGSEETQADPRGTDVTVPGASLGPALGAPGQRIADEDELREDGEQPDYLGRQDDGEQAPPEPGTEGEPFAGEPGYLQPEEGEEGDPEPYREDNGFEVTSYPDADVPDGTVADEAERDKEGGSVPEDEAPASGDQAEGSGFHYGPDGGALGTEPPSSFHYGPEDEDPAGAAGEEDDGEVKD